jgi:hypothetical protein
MRGEAVSKEGKKQDLTTEEAGLYSRRVRKGQTQKKRAHLSDKIRLQMDHTAGSSSSIRTYTCISPSKTLTHTHTQQHAPPPQRRLLLQLHKADSSPYG